MIFDELLKSLVEDRTRKVYLNNDVLKKSDIFKDGFIITHIHLKNNMVIMVTDNGLTLSDILIENLTFEKL